MFIVRTRFVAVTEVFYWFFSVLDSSINAPPTFRPVKKYSDLSGLPVSFFYL